MVCLQFVIVIFLDHTLFLFFILNIYDRCVVMHVKCQLCVISYRGVIAL